eukprot:CAMPEP_0115011276 /NCGR_PEP_ID=MMETSP0216-20121206/23873_1 /TAXON_ID=223996 /ORGANISM="Protocruzia adherens, Strain Boccale" /LENGTH=341 /DNA_ID=CAMNT_0002379767 /DNA_START=270 /DNA_END=1295 /DNA_ORIENTATION=+
MSRNSHRSAKFRRARSYKAETLDSEGPAICDQEQSLEEALEGALNYFSADYSAAFAQAKKRRQAKEQEMEFLKTSHSSEIEAIRGQVASKDRKFAQYQKSLDKANAEAYNSTIQLKAAQKTIVAKDNEIYKLQNDIKDLEAQLKNCGVMLTKERFTNETFAIAYRATSAKTRRPQSGYAHTTKSSQDWSRGTVQSPSRIKMPSPFAQRSDTMNSSFITSTHKSEVLAESERLKMDYEKAIAYINKLHSEIDHKNLEIQGFKDRIGDSFERSPDKMSQTINARLSISIDDGSRSPNTLFRKVPSSNLSNSIKGRRTQGRMSKFSTMSTKATPPTTYAKFSKS